MSIATHFSVPCMCNFRTVTVPAILLFYYKVTSSNTAENFSLLPLLFSLSLSLRIFSSLLLRRYCLEILHLLLSMSAYYSTLILNTNFLCVASFENCIFICYFSFEKLLEKCYGRERRKKHCSQCNISIILINNRRYIGILGAACCRYCWYIILLLLVLVSMHGMDFGSCCWK